MGSQLVSQLAFIVPFNTGAQVSAGSFSQKLTSFSSHKIGGCNSPKDNDISVDTLVPLNSNSTTRIECGEGLGDLVVQSSLANFGNENMIGTASNLDLFRRHFTKNTNGNSS